MSKDIEKQYWEECISCASDECGLILSKEQCECLAESVKVGHENYSMAFYSPPASERISVIEEEWKKKYKTLQNEFDKYRSNAETAVKQALGQPSDANIEIKEYGEVLRHDGRTTQIQ